MGKLENPNMGICKVDERKRITLPPGVLDFLKVKPGDLVCIKQEDGSLCLAKAFIVVRNHNFKNGVGEDDEGSARGG